MLINEPCWYKRTPVAPDFVAQGSVIEWRSYLNEQKDTYWHKECDEAPSDVNTTLDGSTYPT